MITASPSKVKSLIVKTYLKLYKQGRKQRTFLLLGSPGIGKSTLVYEASQEIADKINKTWIEYDDSVASKILSEPNKYFVFHNMNLNQTIPEDLTGIPRTDDDYVTYKPLMWAYVFSKSHGLLFLDDYTDIQDDTVKSLSYRITLDYTVGYIKFHKGVLVVCAGNTPEYSTLSRELTSAQINRVIRVLVTPPSLEDWLEWMEIHNIPVHPRILAYLKSNPQDLCTKPKGAETLESFATPRSWTILCEIIGNDLKYFDVDEIRILAEGLLGTDVANKLMIYLTKNIPSVDDLLRNPSVLDNLDIEGLLIVSAMLGNHLANNVELCERKELHEVVRKLCKISEDLVMVMMFSAGKKRFTVALKIVKYVPEVKMIFMKIRDLRTKFEI